jgi:nitrite reductase/ring-hydroxylating ferredoxin subunit
MLHEGYQKPFQAAGRHLLLLQEGGKCFLLENRCPHAGNPLHQATLADGNLRCPQHGICFNLQSGRAIDQGNIVSDMKLVFFKLVYRDNVIGVDL